MADGIKITVILPSRKRTRGLYAALSTLTDLQSGKHGIQYGVCCDDDDLETQEFCRSVKDKFALAMRIAPRQKTMGGAINDMASRMPADVYLVINDDIFCCSYGWDDVIAKAIEEKPYGIFWWKNIYPMDALYPIVTEKWRAAAGGIFTDHYPFWFDDLCLAELWTMATQEVQPRLDIYICDKPVSTQRMRDLKFWQQFYTKTRVERVRKSIEIAEKLGLPKPVIGEEVAKRLTYLLTAMSDEYLAQIEKNQGETTPPDPAYVVAKLKAEKYLEDMAA